MKKKPSTVQDQLQLLLTTASKTLKAETHRYIHINVEREREKGPARERGPNEVVIG